MNVLRRALGNSSVLLVSQVVTWSASLVLTGTLGRRLGVAGFGDLYLAMSFIVIFGLFVEFGLDQQVVRAIARDRTAASRYLSAAIVLKTLAAAVAYPAMLLTVAGLGYDGSIQRIVMVYGLILVAIGVSASVGAVYQGSQRMLHVAIATVIEKTVVTAAAVALFAAGFGVIEVAAAMVIGSALGALWKAKFISTVAPVAWDPRASTIKALLRGAVPFFLYAILGSVYYRADTVILSKLTDAVVVGWYGAAYRLFDTMVFLPSIVSAAVMFPILAKLAVNSRDQLGSAVGRGLQAISVVGLPICVGLFLIADPLVHLIYGGESFRPAADALRWLTPGLFMLYLNSILTVALVSLNRERRLTALAGLSCVLNITLNILLIPRYQHVGAAAVTSATELFIFGYLLLNLPRSVIPVAAFRPALKAAAAAGVMAVVLLPLLSQPLALVVVVGAAVYVLTGLALGLVEPSDLRAVRMAVRGNLSAVGES
jgi:O-antigen/teichoic acid export membrane protein